MATAQLSVKEIFLQAVEIASPADRAAYLDLACAADVARRRRVEALLIAHERPESLVDRPAVNVQPPDVTTDHTSPERTGTRIGRYRLLEQIGEGGMGTVWVAEQTEPVKRRVAFKVIKPGMDSRQVLSRFEAERQALALMDHPNIAKVFDGGMSDEGRPYFVMEYVKGVPITEYCDSVRLSIQERLRLFAQVCQAVQHAHQKGIIHRDLKPSNILVCLYDGQPVPKLLDFGLAKAMHQPLTEHTLYTAHGLMVGTPLYMSPEQAEFNNLDVDTRTDIYSLGVILYELLTGTTPLEKQQFKDAAFAEILRLIKEVEPPRPSLKISSSLSLPSIAAQRSLEPAQLSRTVRGDLDWIVMKALEKERSRRYETANGLARDIDRYLSDEPVEACPPSAGYRLKKLLRRNKGPVLAAALVLLMLVGGIVGTTWGLIRAQKSRQLADAARASETARAESEAQQRRRAEGAEVTAQTNERQAAAERDRAVRAEADAIEERSKAVTEKQRADEEAAVAKAVNQFLQEDLLAQAGPQVQAERERSVDRDIKLRTVLDRAAARVGDRFQTQPLVDAALRHTIGQAYHSLGEYEKAQQHLERALEIRRRELGQGHLDSLTAMYSLARVLWRQRKYEQAEPLFLQALEGRRKVLGGEHPDTLTAKHGLAALYRAMGNFTRAEPLFLENLTLQRKLLGDEHFDTLETLNSLGVLYGQQGKLEQSEPFATQAFEGRRKALGSEHPETLLSAMNLSKLYSEQKKYAQAEALLAETLESSRKVLGGEHPWTLGTLRDLAQLYQEQGKDAQAEPLLAERLAAARRTSGSEHQKVAAALTDLGQNLLQQGKLAEAQVCLRECLQIREKNEPDAWTTFHTKSSLGGSLLGQERYAESEPLLLQGYEGLKQRESAIPENYKPRLPEAVERLIQLYDGWGKKDEAILATVLRGPGKYQATEESVKSALDACRSSRAADDILTLAVMKQLAATYRTAGKWSQAIGLCEQIRDRQTATLGPDHVDTLKALNALGTGYWYSRQLDKSIPLYEDLVARSTAGLGPTHPDTLLAKANLGVNYGAVGRYREALPFLKAAYQEGHQRASLRFAHRPLADAFIQTGATDEALKLIPQFVARDRAALPANSSQLAVELAGYGRLLLSAKAWQDAEPLFRESLTIREKHLPDSWQRYNAQSLLGAARLHQSNFADAEPLLVAGYQGMKARRQQITPSADLPLTEALQRLIDLYTAWDKPDEAAKWRKILDDEKTAKTPASDATENP